MPKPHPVRSKFLQYLRTGFAHGLQWVDIAGVYEHTEVRAAIKQMERSDPIHHKILHHYMRSKAPRMKIADAVHYDSSTVKRKLDEAVDIILGNLHTLDRAALLVSERFENG